MLVLMSTDMQDKLLNGLDIKQQRVYLAKSRRDGGVKLVEEIYEDHNIQPKKVDKEAKAVAAAAAAKKAAAAEEPLSPRQMKREQVQAELLK